MGSPVPISLFFVSLFVTACSAYLEYTIDGKNIHGQFGTSVSLSPDASIMAVGEPHYSARGALNRGAVLVYGWNETNSTWMPKGQPIIGIAAGDWSGASVSCGEQLVAVGSPLHNSAGDRDTGSVSVYTLSQDGNSWLQRGQTLHGTVPGERLGIVVSLTPDGRYLAVGGNSVARIYVFDDVVAKWFQFGADMVGASGDAFGSSLSISGDGSIVAVGASEYNGGYGYVRVYAFENGNWQRLGNDITGGARSFTGSSVAVSFEGRILAIGASGDLPEQNSPGCASVYEFVQGAWVGKGTPVCGENRFEGFGDSVSISWDGTVLAVGAPNADFHGAANTGVVRLYAFDGSSMTWMKIAQDMGGAVVGERMGIDMAMAMSANGEVLVAGSENALASSGQVRVFSGYSLAFSTTQGATV